MADTIVTEHDFTTNGVVIPAGKVSTDDLQANVRVMDANGKSRNITEPEAKAMQDDLLRRQQERNRYLSGIHEKRTYTKDSGSMGVGGE